MAVLSQLVDDVVATSHELNGNTIQIGRHPECDLRMDEISVSSRHAVIEAESNSYLDGAIDYYISDCDSTNGTFINDIRLSTRQRLNSHDLVRIGWNRFRFIDEDENSLEKTAYILEE
jgi:pSer/pThr/pTyr-binding forkhead associated (FHA) protein